LPLKIYISILIFTLFNFFAYAQKGNRAIDSLNHLITNLNKPDEILQEKANLVLKYFTSGLPEKSSKLYKQSLSEAFKINSNAGKAALFHTNGTLFYYQSQFDSALLYFEKALKIRTEIKDDKGILKSTSNIGSIYYMLGDHKKALIYYEIGLKKEAALNYPEGEYISINNLGYIYSALKIHNKALHYFRKAERIYSKKNGTEQLLYTYDGLSNVCKDLGKLDSALYYAFKSKQIAESLNDISSAGYSCMNIAIFYIDLKKYDLAKLYLDSSLIKTAPFNDKRLQLAAYGNLAAIELRQNRPDSALKYMDKIIPLQKELNVKSNRAELAEIFAKYYFEKKNYELAYKYLDQQNSFKDSLYNSEITSHINEMQTKYETEKKEKENQLLQIENSSYRSTRNYLLLILAIAITGIIAGTFAYRKIKYAKLAIEQKNEQLETQKSIIEEKHKEITDSINYAERIQRSFMATKELLDENLNHVTSSAVEKSTNGLDSARPDSSYFVFFQPKDVVSGDFYWAAKLVSLSEVEGKTEKFLLATADSTGHGVPGAIMSLLNISSLEKSIENETEPAAILNSTRKIIIDRLKKDGSEHGGKDGMDCSLIAFDFKNNKMTYAAANNSIYLVRAVTSSSKPELAYREVTSESSSRYSSQRGSELTRTDSYELIELNPDKMPVGKHDKDSISFTQHTIDLQKGDVIYTLTDGMPDQFGGPRGKKFMYKPLKELLISISQLPMHEQKEKISKALSDWMGDNEQVDDVCVIGIRV